MKKKVKKNILIGALVSVLAVGGINVGIHAIGAVNEAKKKSGYNASNGRSYR